MSNMDYLVEFFTLYFICLAVLGITIGIATGAFYAVIGIKSRFAKKDKEEDEIMKRKDYGDVNEYGKQLRLIAYLYNISPTEIGTMIGIPTEHFRLVLRGIEKIPFDMTTKIVKTLGLTYGEQKMLEYAEKITKEGEEEL